MYGFLLVTILSCGVGKTASGKPEAAKLRKAGVQYSMVVFLFTQRYTGNTASSSGRVTRNSRRAR